LARLTQGQQRLPAAPTPAQQSRFSQQPQFGPQTPQARPFQNQSFRRQTPQALKSQAPRSQHLQGAAQQTFAPAPPKRSIQHSNVKPVSQTQARLAPSDDPGYPVQAYTPQGYGPAVQIQPRAAQAADYAARGAARRRR